MTWRGATDDPPLGALGEVMSMIIIFIISLVRSHPSWRFGDSEHRLPISIHTALKVSDLGVRPQTTSRPNLFVAARFFGGDWFHVRFHGRRNRHRFSAEGRQADAGAFTRRAELRENRPAGLLRQHLQRAGTGERVAARIEAGRPGRDRRMLRRHRQNPAADAALARQPTLKAKSPEAS